jgi:nucleoside 2-deoxyribosyltransferase
VTLVERLVLPRTVFTIMSFKPEFIDVFDSCQDACQSFGFEAERTDETASSEPILPRILTGIRSSAFVIADVSEISSNVFYEVGYAKGLGKEVILIAKKGTELPFDLKDLPTLFWQTQRDLKKGLEERIERIVSKYGR